LIEQIGDAECQLKNTKDSMEECLRSFQRHEKNVVLQEHGLGKTRKTPYHPEDYMYTGAVAAGTLLGVGTAIFLGVGAAASAGAVMGGLGKY
jgi:hypothetical protein